MKRTIGSLLVLAAAGAALAQSAPFTIVRPVDGARVRENVRLLFPKNSIPQNGFIGIYIGGRFIEATVPGVGQEYLYYDLNTKNRNLPDGPLTIEAVLFADFAEKPRILDRSSIQVNIDNSSSIEVPNQGFQLRYQFRRGQQWTYRVENRRVTSTITEAQARAGGRPAQLPEEGDTFRLMYSVDNVYPNGDALIRIMVRPEPGKTYATVAAAGDTEPRRYYDYEMSPLFMRITNTGREVFGAIPRYFPLGGGVAELSNLHLYAAFPLPVLPTDRLRPGDPWNAPILLGTLDLNRAHEVTSLVVPVPARGEFAGVEWERGHRTAKMVYSLAFGAPGRPGGASGPGATGERGNNSERDQITQGLSAIENTVWFSLDRGTVVRSVLRMTRDVRLENQMGQGAQMGAGAAGAAGSIPGGEDRSAGGGGGRTSDVRMQQPPTDPTRMRQGAAGGMTVPGGGVGGGGAAGGGQRGGGAGQGQLLRIVEEIELRLEQ
jgi:hypothetical protein